MASGYKRYRISVCGKVTGRICGFVVAVAFAVSVVSAQSPEWAAGLCGEALKEAVRVHCSPSAVPAEGELWPALLRVDADGDGKVINRFGGDSFLLSKDGLTIEGVTMLPVVDRSWWMPDYALLPVMCRDMHVLYPCESDIVGLRKDYMPWPESVKTYYDNGFIKIGEDVFGQGVWVLPSGYAGELARAILYAACVYPSDLWVGPGAVFMSPGKYPSLSSAAVGYLLGLHDGQMPDDRERQRNEAVAALQGSVNPFVSWPALAGHIWGEQKDVPFGSGDDEPAMKPLKGVYGPSDLTVDLVSPFVPENAVWTVDGRRVAGKRVAVSELGKGKHEFEFSADGCRGKVVVLITD